MGVTNYLPTGMILQVGKRHEDGCGLEAFFFLFRARGFFGGTEGGVASFFFWGGWMTFLVFIFGDKNGSIYSKREIMKLKNLKIASLGF